MKGKQKCRKALAFFLIMLMMLTTLGNPTTNLKAADTLTPEQAIAIKNGDFSNGKKYWNCFAMIWDWVDAKANFTPVEDGINVAIENPGSLGWHVSLGQDIILYPGNTYKASFDIESSVSRKVWTGIEYKYDSQWKMLDEMILLEAGAKKSVSYTFTVNEEYEGEFIIRLGKNEGETYGQHNVIISDVRVEVDGYRNDIILISDGAFGNGIGSFATNVSNGGNALFKTDQKAFHAEIINQGQKPESILLENNNLMIKAGYDYEVSFTARSSELRDIQVVLKDSGSTYLNKTATIDEVTNDYIFKFTADKNGNANLNLLLGNMGKEYSRHDLLIDNICLNRVGAIEALGIKEKVHNIGLPIPPVVSEDAQNNIIGKDVKLTYVDNGTFKNAIKGVWIDNKPIKDNQFTVGNGILTLSSSLFNEEKAYTIEVRAQGYEAAIVKQQIYTSPMWKLVWNDEFNENTVNTSKWNYQEGTGTEYGLTDWGNNEQQYYTRDNIEFEDGALVIKADNNGMGGKNYTSGRLWTGGTFEKTYGKFEAKMKLPEGSGIWPAFWMVPAHNEYGVWASSGELDIMEARGREINKVDGTIHYGRNWPNNQSSGGSYIFENNEDMTGYHLYSVEWEPGEIRWYVDGNLFHKESNWSSYGADNAAKYAYPAPYDRPFNIILNLAVGGSYDGNIMPDDYIFPVYMEVDYVRAYDLVGREPIPAIEPIIKSEAIPSDAKKPENGNYVTDTQYSNVKVINKSNEALDPLKWNFTTAPEFGGAASFKKETINNNTFAKIGITNPGNAVHSIQLIQKVPVVKGRTYKLSFDAKSVDERSMTVKIGGDESRGWSVYAGGYGVDLTKDIKNYSYTFQMLHETDIASRLEFNMGLDSSGVYIGNVVLEESENIYDENGTKEPLKSGNQIYNGTFDQGRQDRTTFWSVQGAEGVVDPEGREMKIVINNAGDNVNAVTLSQKGIQFLKNDTYELTFDARADSNRDITVQFTNKDGHIYDSKKIGIEGLNKTYKVQFTMHDDVDFMGQVIFALGGNTSNVLFDNVILKRITYNNFNFDGIPMHPLLNGNFDAGFAGWTSYGAWAGVEDGVLRVNSTAGGNKWDKLISYDGIILAPGLDYTLSFDARASLPVKIDMTLENSNYSRIKEFTDLAISSEDKHYEFNFRVDSKQTLALKYLTGGANAEYNLYLDNVELYVKHAPLKKPAYLFANSSMYVSGQNVSFDYFGSSEWANAEKELYVNRQKVSNNYLSLDNGKVIIDKQAFNDTGSVQIKLGAKGFENTNTLNIRLLPLDGNLLQNGDFEMGLVGWGNYFHNGCASVQVNEESMAQITVNWHEGADWNAILLQEGLPLEAGKIYELSFDAYASVPRPIRAVIKNSNLSGTVDLSTGKERYSIMFKPDGNMNAELQLLFGYIENGSNLTPDGNHKVLISDICLRESDGNPAPVFPKVTGVKNGEVYKSAVTPGVKYSDDFSFTLSKKMNKADNYDVIDYPKLAEIHEDGYYKLEVISAINSAIKTVVEFEVNTKIDFTKDYFIIKSRANSKVLEVAGTKNGASIIQTNYGERLSQFFTLEELDGGYHIIRSLTSGKVIEVANASMENSAAIQQSEYYGDRNQQWSILYASQGYVKLSNRASGKVIDIPGASGAEGLALKQYEDNGSNAQQWDIVKMDIPKSKDLPDISTESKWKENTIIYPKAKQLVPAGPIYLQWVNTNNFGNVAEYEIYVDDQLQDKVAATDKAVQEYEYYSTSVRKHTMKIVAVLMNGTKMESVKREFFVSKKGVGWGTLYRTQDMNVSWYYHWATDPSAGTDPDLEFVPMIWGNWGSEWLSNPENKKYRTVLGFNEPDFEEQSNVTPDAAIAAWPEFMKTGLRLGSPCSAIPAVWSTWFDQFMTKLNADPELDVDFVAIHCYLDSTDGNKFLEMVDLTWEKYKKPIWITEFGVAAWGEENAYKFNKKDVYNKFMSIVLPGLDEREYVERYAWFPFDPKDPYGGASGIFDYDTGSLNELGLLYRNLGNPEGYELTPLPDPEDPGDGEPGTDPENPVDPEEPENPGNGNEPEEPEVPSPEEDIIRIEAENYIDMDGVAIESCLEGGENVAYIDPGDWMDYKINVANSGDYKVKVRAANPYEELGTLSIQKEGTELGSVAIDYTGGWQNWNDFQLDKIHLDKGEYTIRLYIAGGRYNLNWFELISEKDAGGTPSLPETTNPISIHVEAEDYSVMEGIAAEICGDTGGGQNIGWIDDGDWMEYNVAIPRSDTYLINYRVNGWNTDAELHLIRDNEVLTKTSVFTDSTWSTKISEAITLVKGEYTIRIKAAKGGFNFNWFEIKTIN